jgi:protein-disulfide isomerase
MKKLFLWGSVAAGIILLLLILVKISDTDSNTDTTLDTPISANEHIKGNPDARLTLVEYSDFQCPACSGAAQMIKQLGKDFEQDIKIVYRHFPLQQIHDQAELAAYAAEAAGNQGNFWDMHDVLFNTQPQWSGNPEAQLFFIQLAESIGLEKEQFIQDMDSAKVKATVDANYKSGMTAKIPGTPTFFLNGQIIQTPRSYDAFKTLIKETLENS